jgi:hypothetical protein
MSNISEWSTIEVNNTHLDELTLSGEGALYTNKIMCAVKRKFDEVDGKLDKVQGAFVYKGTKATYADLEAVQNPSVGDVYNVTELSGENFAWNGTSWDSQGAQGVVLTRDAGDDGAAFHNCIYRGKNLTNVYTLAQLSTKLTNGDFSDLYIGDYITKSFTYGGTTKNVNFRFAHFNYWKYMGNIDNTNGKKIDGTAGNTYGQTTVNHIALVPDVALFDDKMNDTDTTEGGVRGCALWAKLQSDVYTALNASNCLDGHILSYSDIISTTVDAAATSSAGSGFLGSSNNWAWCDKHIGFMTESMVYGGQIFSSSGRDSGCKKSQLRLFAIDPTWINGRASRSGWWLGAVASASLFAFVGGNGRANCSGASVSLGVRPLILFS